MSVLDRIQQPRDLRLLHRDELLALCREIREFTVESVQKTGGDISSRLRAAAITLALHRALDSPRGKSDLESVLHAFMHKLIISRRGGVSKHYLVRAGFTI